MAYLIQIRRDTLADWNSNNPVLQNGEIAFVMDQNKIKIGDGVNTFSNLPYLGSSVDDDQLILAQRMFI